MRTHDQSKLPQWAQQQMKVYEMRITELQNELDTLEAGDTPIRYRIGERYYYAPNTTIEFRVDDGKVARVSIERGGLYVNMSGDRLCGASIQGESFNALRIFPSEPR